MKIFRGTLSILVLLLILFYLALFTNLEYRPDNISERGEDRWPLANQILSGLSSFLTQVDNCPMPLASWAPKEAGSQLTDLALTLTDNEINFSSDKKSLGEYFSQISQDGAFDFREFMKRLRNYRPEETWLRP